MAAELHGRAEKRVDGKWTLVQNVRLEGSAVRWLTRGTADVPPLAKPRGMLVDTAVHYEARFSNGHSDGWFYVHELARYDYDEIVRPEGQRQSLEAHLGRAYFDMLAALEAAGAERLVFWLVG
jgi:hypothetical protein